MRRRLRAIVRPLRSEEGFTLIEVVIAALVLSLAALATFGVLAAATRNAQRAQATQVALDKAQAELEKLHTLSYEQLALTTTPSRVSSPLSPNSRVLNGDFDLKRGPATEWATMVANGGEVYGENDEKIAGGVVVPGPISFEEGNVKGELYRYILWRDDPSCPESEDGSQDFCPGDQDYKQIVVAAKFNASTGGAGERGYVEVQSQVANPETFSEPGTGGADPDPDDETGGLGTGNAVTGQQFFLTDTPCSTEELTVREDIVGDHPLHNTLGNCGAGLKTGESEVGAPDAMLLGAPPDPAPEDENNPLVYDYASDFEPESNTDEGLQVLREANSGCSFAPAKGANPQAKQHRWLSDKMPIDFQMKGLATLELYSQTVNEVSYPGRICVFIFIRHDDSETEWTDTLLTNSVDQNAYWTFASGAWYDSWKAVRLPMTFAPKEIEAGDRLGVAISVEPAGTTNGDLEFLYDHPAYPSRIEVDTTTTLERG